MSSVQKTYQPRVLYPEPDPLPIPKRVLVFDVETTGLLPRNPATATNEDYPYILQLSYVIYSMEKQVVVHTSDAYINVVPSVKISDEITKITGITREMCDRGHPIELVLIDFYRACISCDYAVAHNIDFDTKVIQQEMYRNRQKLGHILGLPDSISNMCGIFGKKFLKEKHLNLYCTMKHGAEHTDYWIEREKRIYNPDKTWTVCYDASGIPIMTKTKKMPKLSELFIALMPEEKLPENLHNSMVDVMVCLKCFIQLQK